MFKIIKLFAIALFCAIALCVYLSTKNNHVVTDSERKSSRELAQNLEPDEMIAEMMIRKSLKPHLKDESSLTLGAIKKFNHEKGVCFTAEYSAKNSFGARTKEGVGLLWNLETKEYTLFLDDQIPTLVAGIIR